MWFSCLESFQKKWSKWRNMSGVYRLLVVDDEKDLAKTIQMIWDEPYIQVDICYSGEDALALLEKNKYHALLTDVRMSGMDGLELMRRVKVERKLTIPVYIMTGFTDHSDERIFQAGADGVFRKPDDLENIEEVFLKAAKRFLG